MQYSSIFKALGAIILVLAVALVVPTLYAGIMGTADFKAFLYSTLLSVLSGGFLLMLPKSPAGFKSRNGFALVSFGWLSAGFFGCLPFWFSGYMGGFTNAYFESISGFTTTGSSIRSEIEALPQPTLLWRSMTQWLGGMGIIVLSLAILPYLDLGGMSIFQAEVPGPTAEKLTPRIQDTAKVLWLVYCIITLACILALWLAGMNWFESVNHAFTALSTGGFSTRNTSVAGFQSPGIEWVLTFFMFIAGMNFALHYRFLFKGLKWSVYEKDSEFRFYGAVFGIAVAAIVAVILAQGKGGDLHQVVRDASFTVSSIMTTTGYGTADYELWPVFAQFILLFIMILGGSAGSTSGGIKSVRIMLVLKYMYAEMLKLLHPSLVRSVKIGNQRVQRDVLASILSFIFVYTTVMILSILAVSIQTDDMITSISAVVACLSNIGPGFGSVGPTENFAHLSVFTKWVLALDMVMGRLEILTILVLFFPQTWKK